MKGFTDIYIQLSRVCMHKGSVDISVKPKAWLYYIYVTLSKVSSLCSACNDWDIVNNILHSKRKSHGENAKNMSKITSFLHNTYLCWKKGLSLISWLTVDRGLNVSTVFNWSVSTFSGWLITLQSNAVWKSTRNVV